MKKEQFIKNVSEHLINLSDIDKLEMEIELEAVISEAISDHDQAHIKLFAQWLWDNQHLMMSISDLENLINEYTEQLPVTYQKGVKG